MRIAVIGAQGTGKSTLCKKLIKHQLFKDYTYKPSGTSELKKSGKLKNKNVNFERHQLHLYYANATNLLTDRCVWDTMYYGTKDFQEDLEYCTYLENTAVMTLEKFDYIILLEPEFEIENNGVRSLSKQEQQEYTQAFKDYYLENHLNNYVKLICPKGTVEQRVQYIIEQIS